MKTPRLPGKGMKNSNKSLIISGVKTPGGHKKGDLGRKSGRPQRNADYQYNKKRLREIDRRVRYPLNAWKISKSSITPLSRKAKLFWRVGGD